MIDLASDTKTRPTPAMRRAIYTAEVGDDHFGEDPTVNTLVAFGAELLGKEAALFLPSATMANQIAIKIHTRLGDEVICHEHAHILLYESGGPAFLSGCLLRPLSGARGVFSGAQVRAAVRPDGPYFPPTRLVCIENTHNAAGGTVWREAELDDVADAAAAHGLPLHVDGSRLLNAAVASGIAPARLVRRCDTVTLCLSKGLGAPAGALLLGTRDAIAAARRWKHAFGGAMRQAGILAAGGLHALTHHIERLADDHDNARRLAAGLADIPGVRPDPFAQTNLVFVDIAGLKIDPATAVARLEREGVLCSGTGTRLRFVTHLDISAGDVDAAIEAARRAWTSRS